MAATMEETSALIEEKAKLCLLNRKNVNNIVDIISEMKSEDNAVVTACILAIQGIFEKFISTHEMTVTENSSEGSESEAVYRKWLRQQYCVATTCLQEQLHHSDQHIQKLAFVTLMKLVAAEGHHPIKAKSESKETVFPRILFNGILTQIVSEETDTLVLVAALREFLKYDDIRYSTLQYLMKSLKKSSQDNDNDVYLTNVFNLLERCSHCKCKSNRLSFWAADSAGKMASSKEHCKLFTSTWLAYLSSKLTLSLYKRTLVILKDKVMPKLSSPLLLSDFLTESYNMGGVVSLLALDGLFLLINKYNMEYPEFYEKLYTLLEPAVFHVKYRDRFFHLTDLFLSSTHLPSYLVAAFAKKMSRICLTAPSVALPAALVFVYNLLKRHPSCQVLIHRPGAAADLDEDPYLYDEPDPAKCNALQSSLWEIKTLQSHFCPGVSKMAARIDLPLHHTEDLLEDFLGNTETKMMKKELKKKVKTIPVTFEPPKGLFGTKGDKLHTFWTLQ